MAEVADTGEDHGEVEAVGGFDHLRCRAWMPPGWMTAVAPAWATTSRPSGNGKKASEAATEPERGAGRRFHGAEAGGVDAGHLAGADADGLAVALREKRA